MKKVIFGVAGSMTALFISGCVGLGPRESNGYIPAPMVLDNSYSGSHIDNSVQCLKSGTATSRGTFCLSEGDATITAAMKNGNIKKVHHVDYKVRNIFGFTGVTTVTVWGE